MTSDLGMQARNWARHYVLLVNALMKEGVTEKVAREEARVTALIMMFDPEDAETETCPLCGRGEE